LLSYLSTIVLKLAEWEDDPNQDELLASGQLVATARVVNLRQKKKICCKAQK